MRHFLVYAHCNEYVRGFKRAGRAGGAGGNGNALQVQSHQKRLAFHAHKRKVGMRRRTVFAVGVQYRVRNVFIYAFNKLVAQFGDIKVVFTLLICAQLANSRAQSDNAACIQCAAAAVLFLVSAALERVNGYTFTNIQGAYSFRSVYLMSGTGQEVYIMRLNITSDKIKRLGGITMEIQRQGPAGMLLSRAIAFIGTFILPSLLPVLPWLF